MVLNSFEIIAVTRLNQCQESYLSLVVVEMNPSATTLFLRESKYLPTLKGDMLYTPEEHPPQIESNQRIMSIQRQ
jgi:hypothetical protein